MRFSSRALLSVVGVWAVGLGACIASAPSGLHRETDPGDAGDEGILIIDSGPPDPIPDAGEDPHAVVGADPSHGPFSGGGRVLVRGRGFTSAPRVWFGDVEVPTAGVSAIDPSRIQVTAPAGKAGPVDIVVQNGDDASTKRSLAGAYAYDAIYAVPSSGPISGGTIVQIVGQGTHFSNATTVEIDMKTCTGVTVMSDTSLTCTAPRGTPGSKTVKVTTGNEAILVLDAFTYQDSDNGYKGGLSGLPLAGHLKVLVYDNYTGAPLAADVVLGAPIETAIVAQTDASGLAQIDDASLQGSVMITVASSCHSPQTFAAVPVDTATIYLDPILTPACAGMGDPPPVGGKSGSSGTVTGELVWPIQQEFKRGNWQNVPAPHGPSERKAAYVMSPAYDPTYPYYQPNDSYVVTQLSPGTQGFGFTMSAYPGTQSFYALAGIENTDTLKFTAYVLGVVRGVPVHPDETTDSVFILMDHTLDQVVTLDVSGPTPGPKGPDRLETSVAVQLGSDGFLVVPASDQAPLLPYHGALAFVGLPALDGALAGMSYITTARGVTGPSGGAPTSVIAQIRTGSASEHVPVQGFVGVPSIGAPAVGGPWDGKHLATTFAAGGTPADVTVFDVVAGNGLAHWLVTVPGVATTIEVPDISGFSMASLPHGAITITVIGGTVDGFDYANLRYRNIRTYGMTAYALDYFSAHY